MSFGREDIGMTRETRQKLLSAVFPALRYGDDPDIERYLELRRDGRVADALNVYNGALRIRYPGDGDRALLIALKRSHDQRWLELQRRLLDNLAESLEIKIQANISLIVQSSVSATSRDAYGSLQAVNAVLSRLGSPDSVDAGIAVLERHLKFARVLAEESAPWKTLVRGLESSLRLLEEYAALAKYESPDEQDFVSRSRALEERRRSHARPRSARDFHDQNIDFVAQSRLRQQGAQKARQSHFFDLDRIRFSKAEIATIELEKPPKRLEDLVIAWCAKYWRVALDPRFERIVFLYSSKFHTRHFEIFRELRRARLKRLSDDEMLTGMSSLLSTGYSYSVSGDLYMQRRWMAVKAGLFGALPPSALQAAPEAPAAGSEVAPLTAQYVAPLAAPLAPKSAAQSAAPPGTVRRRPPTGLPAPLPPPEKARPSKAIGPAAPAAPAAPTAAPAPAARPAHHEPPVKRSGPGLRRINAQALAPAKRPAGAEAVPSLERRATGSISDRIRRLSGRQYDVYRNIFLEKVRDSIHRGLLAAKTRQRGIFDTSVNEAEDAVHGFIVAHYDDPFMDWETSRERALVESLGFSMPLLDGIIEDCYKRL